MPTIYKMDHMTIHFSSTNPDRTVEATTMLKGYTSNDVRNNLLPHRHATILALGLAGDFPLFDQYMRARGLLLAREEKILRDNGKHAYNMKGTGKEAQFWGDVAHEQARAWVFKHTGWKF